MNIKNMLLVSILMVSAAVVKPSAFTNKAAADNLYNRGWTARNNTTIAMETLLVSALPGIIVGGTGAAISYLTGHLFDALANNAISLLAGDNVHVNRWGSLVFSDKATAFQKSLPALIALARLGAQVGSKWYWEKPLRNKIMNWLQEDLKARGVEFNAELMKTVARVSAWLGCVSQVKSSFQI